MKPPTRDGRAHRTAPPRRGAKMKKSKAKMSDGWVSYDFAVLRVVPHVYIGTFVPVGVIVHARTTEFLGMRVLTDAAELTKRAPGVDDRAHSISRVVRGDLPGDLTAVRLPSRRHPSVSTG